jgi:predicted nuclease of predicted toxin-antitoxin system
MRFKVDENLPIEVAALLRDAGHEADTVMDEGLGGAIDDSIANRCREEDRVVVTLDVDFANIRAYPPENTPAWWSSGWPANASRTCSTCSRE